MFDLLICAGTGLCGGWILVLCTLAGTELGRTSSW